MSGRVYLGFDPGMAGAVAAIHPDGEAVVFDMPTVVTVRTRREVVARELAAIVAPLAAGGDAVAVFEQQAGEGGSKVRDLRGSRSPTSPDLFHTQNRGAFFSEEVAR